MHIFLQYSYQKPRNIFPKEIPPTMTGAGGWSDGFDILNMHTVTPFKFAAIKVRGFEIMTYSRPFNFAVSYQNYFTVSYTNVVFLHKLTQEPCMLKIIKF